MIEATATKIYLAKKSGYTTDGNEIATYSTPVAYRITVQPVSGYLDIQTYGARVQKMYKAVVGVERYKDVFHEGDKAYLEGAEPTNETVNGQNANYLVISVRPQYKAIQVYFEKLQIGE
jgi:hypothetical protein